MKNTLRTVFFTAAAVLCATLCGCAHSSTESVSEISVTEPASAPAVQDDLLLGIDLTHPDSDDRDTVYMLFVKKDGTVITTQYTRESDYNFFLQKALRNPDIWNHAEPAAEIGRLTDAELTALSDAAAAADPNAEKTERGENEPTPDVEETYHLTYYLYPAGKPEICTVMAIGAEKGVSLRSDDPNAQKAVKLIQDSELYQQWLKAHTS